MDQENPENLPAPKYRIRTQLNASFINTEERDAHLNVQLIRLKTQSHAKKISQVWKLSEAQITDFFFSYESLPQSRIVAKQLINIGLRIIKTDIKVYLGQIHQRKKEGKGIAIYRTGRVYQGQFFANEKSGYGCQLFQNGNFYFGSYCQNKKHGQGSFFWFNLCEPACLKTTAPKIQQYHGSWWGGLPDGKGEHQKVNGDYYTGSFKNGLKHGQGKQMYHNGDVYEGEFVNGLPEGYGQYKWADGSIYKGDFKQGYRNGYGLWQSSNKKQKYKGQYLLDQKHGYGTHEKNNQTYKGHYFEDLRNGEGELYKNDELVYQGTWENGERTTFSKSKSKRKQKLTVVSQKIQTKEDIQTKTNFRIKTSKAKYLSVGKRQYTAVTRKPKLNFSNCESPHGHGHRRCIACCRKQMQKELKKDGSALI